jgi:hypothetical protein
MIHAFHSIMMKSCYYLLATSLLLDSSLKSNLVFVVQALSIPNNSNNDSGGGGITTTLSDRFRCSCPAPLSSIRLFDPSLVVVAASDEERNSNNNADDAVIWAAVFRFNQNQPSVFIRDEFLNAMKAAIEPVVSSSVSSLDVLKDNLLETPESKQVPVAVACLRPATSTDFGNGCYVLDTLRCVLKKEAMDASCDGGSEHCEAISVAIDSLLLHHLSTSSSSSKNDSVRVFEQAIRAKATIYTGKILEVRGFEPITELQKDMATHISSLDACMEKYAERSVNAQNMVAKSPGAQQRALSILSSLARLDRDAEIKAAAAAAARAMPENGKKDDYDPFSSITRFI